MSLSPPDPTTTAVDDATIAAIADGRNVPWTGTFTHPEHGELTFRGWLPTFSQLAQHSIQMDNVLHRLDGDARGATMVMVAALAGMHVLDAEHEPSKGILLELPVIREDREEGDDSKVTLTRVFYRAEDELHISFLISVWSQFSAWREQVLQGADRVKGS